MIRFVHTADWQIGMKAAGLGDASQRVRDVRLDSVERIVELARERDIELLLITGDVFEDNAVDRSLVRKVGETLSRFRGQVFITPGNHDPLTPGSVWEHPVWEENSHVHVLRDRRPIELENCVLYPCPLKEKYSTRNPLSSIDASDTHKVAIGLAHGNVEGLPDAEPDYPIPVDAAQKAGLDFLAIGHWHSFSPYKGSDGIVRMAYSGTHETTKFGERDSGNVLLVKIAERGAVPQIESLRTGALKWLTLDRSIAQADDLARLSSELKAIEDPGNCLVRIRLDGLLFMSARAELELLNEILTTRFLYGFLSIERMTPAPEDDSWIEELPVGVLRESAETIRQQAFNGSDEQTRLVATRALLELFELKEKAAL
ncbi:DNA repair exonuclease [Puniceicoccaceae bacterium K14]|nr:DNA repair exonuclease [Puniceicoccaceae bacterium K14]